MKYFDETSTDRELHRAYIKYAVKHAPRKSDDDDTLWREIKSEYDAITDKRKRQAVHNIFEAERKEKNISIKEAVYNYLNVLKALDRELYRQLKPIVENEYVQFLLNNGLAIPELIKQFLKK